MMQLLDVLSQHTMPATLKQLAFATQLHPSTAHRILGVMVDNRLVDRIEPGTYRLGIRLVELGSLVKSRISVRQEALPYMQALHQQLGETVNLSVRRDDEVVYIERTAEGNTMMRVVQIIGARAPLHITAVGKIFLAADTPQRVAEYAKRSGLPRFTDQTLTELARLNRELDEIRSRHYAYDNEEAERGVCCVGAGILNDEAQLVAGLSVSAPTERFKKNWAEAVRQAAERISRALGYRPL
ncbi:MAG: IclR family transcriptional regulator [Burkholderiales bacterium]|nr:IclR family transcriptional regulator [Burkholderiales bacterium]MDP2397076.1 IclR family transcriptional regulator [Burkholderiales bacterium]